MSRGPQIMRTQKPPTTPPLAPGAPRQRPGDPLYVSPTGRTVRIWGWRKPKSCRECLCWDWPGVGFPRRDDGDPRPGWFGTSDVVFVGEAPGTEEIARGRQFIGSSGRVLNSLVKSAGFDSRNVLIQNAVRCARGSAASAKPPRTAIRCCAPLLMLDIEAANPRLIVALGEWAVRSLAFSVPQFLTYLKAGRKGAPSISITKLDGIAFPVRHHRLPRLERIAVMFHPAYFLKPGRSRQIQFAYEKFKRLGEVLK